MYALGLDGQGTCWNLQLLLRPFFMTMKILALQGHSGKMKSNGGWGDSGSACFRAAWLESVYYIGTSVSVCLIMHIMMVNKGGGAEIG